MKKVLFISILTLIILSIVPASAARSYDFDMGDDTLWTPVEESYIEGQLEKEQGPIRVSRGIGIGWFKASNAVEVLEKVDFGNGLQSMTAMVAAQYPEGYFAENMPDAIFEIRIDSYDGPVVATVKPEGSDGWDIEVDAECTITDIGKETKGEHTIYIVNQIGTPEEYIAGTIKGSCNFNKLTLETDAVEPTPTPSPEPTEAPTPSPTKVAKTTQPPDVSVGSSTNLSIAGIIMLVGLALGIAALIAFIVIIIVVIVRRKRDN